MSNFFLALRRFLISAWPYPSRTANRSQTIAQLLPRHMQPMEAWLLMFCGMYGLLVGAVMGHSLTLRLLCLGFVALAVVRYLQPAQTRRQWLLGAGAALLLTASIYINPESGGATGPYLFLLLLLGMGYPLVMGTAGAVGFSAALVAIYLGSAWFNPIKVPMQLFAMRAILVVGICALSARMGHSLRQSQWLFEMLLHDNDSLAYNSHGLHFYGERTLRRCMAERRPCSLALLRMPHEWHHHKAGGARGMSMRGLLEPATTHDERAEALQDMAQHLMRAAPRKSVVARTSQGDWVVVTPGVARKQLLRELMVALGHPLQLPYGDPAQEMFVALIPCVVQADSEHDNIDTLLQQAHHIWSRSERAGTVSLA